MSEFNIAVSPSVDDEYSIRIEQVNDGLYELEIIEAGLIIGYQEGLEIVAKLTALEENDKLPMSAIGGLSELADDMDELNGIIENFDCGLF